MIGWVLDRLRGLAANADKVEEQRPDDRNDPQVFVLKRELSAVHLLLDHISSDPNSRLFDAEKDKDCDLPDGWLDQVCAMNWPPVDSGKEKAAQASLLVKVKDHLNARAKPASSASIAFTVLVTQDSTDRNNKKSNNSSRSSLAITAYPELLPKAERFRKTMWWVFFALLLWLFMTCTFSCYVAFGNAVLTDRAKIQIALTDAIKQVEATENTKPGNTQNATESGTDPRQDNNMVTPVMLPAKQQCLVGQPRDSGPKLPGDTGQRRGYSSMPQLQACQSFDREVDALADTDELIKEWTLFSDGVAGAAHSSFATYLGNILGTALLPIFYGILGAGTALVRTMSKKMRDSVLTPRDLNLSFQRLALGAVMGACIGLFVAQPTTGTADAGAMALTGWVLSGSALSFVAGFGVDAVFGALETIIGRIFNVQPVGSTSTPANH